MKVSECMSREVRLCSPEDSVVDVARTMKECGAGALPVGENDRLVGMITDRDIVVRTVASGKGSDARVRDAMTREIHFVFEDEELETASDKMSRLKIRRLPVLSRDKRMVGILSLGDVWSSEGAPQAAAALHGVAQQGGPHMQT
jgi:CBS domain-containing protein